MRRIVVLGTSGSGKSTFAQRVGERLKLQHVEIDALHWGPNWSGAPTAVLRQRVASVTNGENWIIDGNYSAVRDAIWPRADTLIWLDYPMTIVFSRVVRRTFRRWWTDEVLWGGNRERLWEQFLSRHSLFLWVVQTWRIHRRDYPRLLREQAEAGKRIVRLRRPQEAEWWIANLQSSHP
jgi:adenylate kinase family enzyme